MTLGKTALMSWLMRMMAHREIHIHPTSPRRGLLMAKMRAVDYLPDDRFRRIAPRDQLDVAVMAVALAALLRRRMRSQQTR